MKSASKQIHLKRALFNFTMNYSIFFARFLMGLKNDFTFFFTFPFFHHFFHHCEEKSDRKFFHHFFLHSDEKSDGKRLIYL